MNRTCKDCLLVAALFLGGCAAQVPTQWNAQANADKGAIHLAASENGLLLGEVHLSLSGATRADGSTTFTMTVDRTKADVTKLGLGAMSAYTAVAGAGAGAAIGGVPGAVAGGVAGAAIPPVAGAF